MAEDGELYFVKGKGAGYASLIKEWVAGSLAATFKLPIPEIAILNVPKPLFEMGRNGLLSDLGHGPVFGSKALTNTNEISTLQADTIPVETRRRIAVFDWWIMNGDRTLSENGGNPNILWDTSHERAFVIDHNLAFDKSVTLATMERDHIFGSLLTEIIGSPDLQSHWSGKLGRCLQQWEIIVDALPDRWRYVDEHLSVPNAFSPEVALEALQRFNSLTMWTR